MKRLSLPIFRHPNDIRRIVIAGYFKCAFFRSKQANFVEIYLLVEWQIILSRAGCVGQLMQITSSELLIYCNIDKTIIHKNFF